MAEKQIVAATVSVETQAAQRNVLDLNNKVSDLKKELAGAQKGSDEQFAAFQKLKGAQDELGKATDKLNKTIADQTGHFSNIKNKLGEVSPAFSKAGEGVDGLGAKFRILLANPVVLVLTAIVAVLALVYKAFTNTFEGGEKMEQVFAGIKAAGQALIDNLERIGGAIVKLFKFDFSGAVSDIKGVAKAAGEAYNAMADLTKQAQSLHKEQLSNDLDAAKRAKDLAILREQATDESVPIKQRIALLQQLKVAAEQNSKDDIDLAKRTTDNKIAQLTLEKDGEKKNQDEINKIKIEQINVETDNANELRRIGKQLTAAEKSEQAERTAAAKEAQRVAKEHAAETKRLSDERIAAIKKEAEAETKAFVEKIKRQQQELANDLAFGDQLTKEQEARDKAETKRQFDNEQLRLNNKKKLAELNALDNPDDPKAKVALIQAQLDLENSVLADNDIQKQINAKNASDAIVQITKDEVDAKNAIRDIERQHTQETVAAIGDAFGTLSELAGKQTAAGKAFAIAQTTIATFQAGFAAFKGMVTTIPGPVGIALGVVAAAGALASGIAAVKKIVAVQVPGGGGGGSAPAGGISLPAAPVAPVQSSTSLDQSSINGIGNAANVNSRAYVLDSDIQNNRERDARLSRASRLG
jgi:hypothetical protein